MERKVIQQHVDAIKKIAREQFVLEGETNIHGFNHWEAVERNAIMLSMQEGVDELVVRLFAYLHDSQRLDDGADPLHGERAAVFVTQLRKEGKLSFLSDEQYGILYEACRTHHTGVISLNDITLGACFDADRLELDRVGIIPDPKFMSTRVGKFVAIKMRDIANFSW
jgi:uncharacterized protein